MTRERTLAYKRGSDTMQVELANVQSCLEALDPLVRDKGGLEDRIDSLEATRDNLGGKFTVIIWLVGLNVSILVGLIIALFGSGKLTIHANFAPSVISSSQNSPPQSAHW